MNLEDIEGHNILTLVIGYGYPCDLVDHIKDVFKDLLVRCNSYNGLSCNTTGSLFKTFATTLNRCVIEYSLVSRLLETRYGIIVKRRKNTRTNGRWPAAAAANHRVIRSQSGSKTGHRPPS